MKGTNWVNQVFKCAAGYCSSSKYFYSSKGLIIKKGHHVPAALAASPPTPPISSFYFNSSFSVPWILSPGEEVGRALSAWTFSRIEKKRTWTNCTDCGENDFPFFTPAPTPWRCELFPAKQLTFQTHFLNFVKPFISVLLFGPCFTFHNIFFIIYHAFTFQLRMLAVCKSYPVGGLWNTWLKLF